MPTIPSPEDPQGTGGLVTLIAGPPGSGKTSLCLSIGSRMAELGCVVRYIATEEERHTLEAKRTAIAEPATELLWPSAPSLKQPLGNWAVISGGEFKNLKELSDQLIAELSEALEKAKATGPSKNGVYLVFPRVVVIDSMTALLHAKQRGKKTDVGRRELGQILNALRRMGICVFLVGALQDCDDEGLAT